MGNLNCARNQIPMTIQIAKILNANNQNSNQIIAHEKLTKI